MISWWLIIANIFSLKITSTLWQAEECFWWCAIHTALLVNGQKRRLINVTYSYKRLVFFDLVPPILMGVRSVTEQIKGRIYSPSTASKAVLSASLPCPKPLKKRATLKSFSSANFPTTRKIRTADWYPASYEARLAPLNSHFPPDCQAIVFPALFVKVMMVLLWLDLQWRRYLGISIFIEPGNDILGNTFPVGGSLCFTVVLIHSSFEVSVEKLRRPGTKDGCLADDVDGSIIHGFEVSVEKLGR